MPVSNSYLEFVQEQLTRIGPVTVKKMFGGVGLYAEELFFGLIANNTLYFKVNDSNRRDYEKAGMEAFRPYGGDTQTMSYYEVPPGAIENADKLKKWFDKAVQVAAEAKRKPRKKRRK